ncbi:hypothetical protein MNBD_GAMMA21-1821 [hydrothermal vent metagenome]|uniref:Phosphotyrosine protein phosphatase I domain-containing protein n=1 Tax=hydrothermal vent metagenome TaxID=652676 RepID=A0A3B0ZRM8_9ZZZZ
MFHALSNPGFILVYRQFRPITNGGGLTAFFIDVSSHTSKHLDKFLDHSFGGDDFEVCSAGLEPKGLHPMTKRVMHENNIDVSSHTSKHLDKFLDQSFDYIITVCNQANDNCPTFPGDNVRIHWCFEDPAVITNDIEAQYQLFKRVRSEISERIRVWVTVQRKKLKDMGLVFDTGGTVIAKYSNHQTGSRAHGMCAYAA